MSSRSFLVPDALAQYLETHAAEIDDIQRDLINETRALGDVGGMQIAPDQGALLTLLTRLIGAHTAVEVGTFTGYSALCIARGLAPGGHLLCCDVSEEWTSIARRYWTRAGLDDRIELRLGPAVETLRELPNQPNIDIAFIDADKDGYAAYWAELVPRVRRGGLLLVDNTLWSGLVVEASDDTTVTAIRAFNDMVAADPRCESLILPVADGLTIALRR